MKKTATVYTGTGFSTKWITCEVTGETNTGRKVWTDLKTGEQYLLFKCTWTHHKKFMYFCHI